MMAARPLRTLTRGLGRNALDLPVAALAGLAIAVIVFVLPPDLLGRLIGATGLPAVIGAAAPPLGFKARLACGLVGAGTIFAIVYALLRLFDRKRAPQARPRSLAAQVEPDLPRLRRRDVHPDAPARRPISAARDLGEPAPPEANETSPPAPRTARIDTPAGVERKAAPPPSVTAPSLAEASLDDLMRRLEQGLVRGRERRAFARAPQSRSPMPQVFPDAGDDRLQSAIDGLQRLAGRTD